MTFICLGPQLCIISYLVIVGPLMAPYVLLGVLAVMTQCGMQSAMIQSESNKFQLVHGCVGSCSVFGDSCGMRPASHRSHHPACDSM
jgi:hypothetical protein